MHAETQLSKSELASALGRLGKGKKKTITPEERERRSQHLTSVNQKRLGDKREKKLIDESEVQRRIIEEGLTA